MTIGTGTARAERRRRATAPARCPGGCVWIGRRRRRRDPASAAAGGPAARRPGTRRQGGDARAARRLRDYGPGGCGAIGCPAADAGSGRAAGLAAARRAEARRSSGPSDDVSPTGWASVWGWLLAPAAGPARRAPATLSDLGRAGR